MKCEKCHTEYSEELTLCPVCGTPSAPSTSEEAIKQPAKFPLRSRGIATLVAWASCGILTWLYLGDKVAFRQRLKALLKWLPFCIIVIGLIAWLCYGVYWMFSDIIQINSGKLRYSDGRKVKWR